MISDPDIWSARQLMIKRHGEGAAIAAAQRADEFFNEGDCRALLRPDELPPDLH
jgi:hypothetical protein